MHVVFPWRCQSNMGFKEKTHKCTHTHTHNTCRCLEEEKNWGYFLLKKNESIRKWDITTHRPVPVRTTTLCVMENSEKYDSKVFLQNLIINAVSYFWNLFLAPTYVAWETSVLIVIWSQGVNSRPNAIRRSVFRALLCPQELLWMAQALTIIFNALNMLFILHAI